MLRRNAHRRAGVTLIELLVVIGIIATLMSLILAAVGKVRDAGVRAETTARISATNSAIGTFKGSQSFGQVKYIPPGRLDTTTTPPTWQAFRLRNQYATPAGPGEPDQFSFEAQYLQQVFGGGRGLDLTDLGYRDASGQPNLAVNLDANQTLTFFLAGIPEVVGTNAVFTGFSTNPQRPFIRRATTDETRKGPILDLGGRQKYVIEANGFASIIDAYGRGTQFAYFSAYDGQQNKYYGGYNPKFAVTAYSRNGQFENPSGFQLISAGKDGIFGATGNWVALDVFGADDQANFSPALLASGPN
jgi:prepilin-type N-terminal cleavage/methylation domain-containing protein